jgi:hypothetical protein
MDRPFDGRFGSPRISGADADADADAGIAAVYSSAMVRR